MNTVQNLDSERAGNTIFQVLQQRHIQERVQREDQFNREIDAAKAEARARMAETRQAEREELIAEQEKVTWFKIEVVLILHRKPSRLNLFRLGNLSKESCLIR